MTDDSEKEFLTFEEAAEYIGKIKRSSLYNYVKTLKIQTHKFPLDRRTFLAIKDVKRIKEVREKPWTATDAA